MRCGACPGTSARNPRPASCGQGGQTCRRGVQMKRAALAFSFIVATLLAGHADAQTPRRGGTIRMTAPYGTNISTLDIQTTPRAQDDIYGHVVHPTPYIYDSEKGAPVLELAKSVTVSNNGLPPTFKPRDDVFF